MSGIRLCGGHSQFCHSQNDIRSRKILPLTRRAAEGLWVDASIATCCASSCRKKSHIRAM